MFNAHRGTQPLHLRRTSIDGYWSKTRCDGDESPKKWSGFICVQPFFSGAPPPCTSLPMLPPSPHRSSAQAMQQPQGDLVTLLRSECSPVLISGHINFPTSYILLRDRPLQHLRLTPVLMTLTAICSINTVFFDIVFTCRVLWIQCLLALITHSLSKATV